jgi:hypothetical protein
MEKPPMRVSPEDKVIGLDEESTVLDFWQWAFSDLCDDDIKGWYAEWVVGRLLGLYMDRRISWANSDLISPGGVRIEVKATSYWQSWKLLDEFGKPRDVKPLGPRSLEKIRFGGLRAGDAVDQNGPISGYKSDFYVFAFQNEREHGSWDALNLKQWEFYLLSQTQLKGSKSISLHDLRKECASMSASELRMSGRTKIREIEGKRCDLFTQTNGHILLSASVLLKDGQLRGVGSTNVLESVFGEAHQVRDRAITSQENPEEWFDTLELMYHGSYFWAKSVS